MAEAVISPLATYVLENLTSLLDGWISSLYGLRDELKELKDTVSSIEAILRDADVKRELSDQEVHLVGELKDVLYDADDLLDLVSLQAAHVQGEGRGKVAKKACIFISKPKLAKKACIFNFKPKLAKKVKQIREDLDLIAKRMTIKVEPWQMRRRMELVNRETSSVEHEHVIGRDKDVAAIKEFLFGSDNHVSFMAIVGIGGLGKTTLARSVFNDAEVTKHFKKSIWVCVSDDEFDAEKIYRNIIQSASGKKPEVDGMESLQKHLQQLISEQKYLLILDDVWSKNQESWKKLMAPLLSGGKGSKILLTTRDRDVGNAAGAHRIYPLKDLSKDDSWNLFEQIIVQQWKKELDGSDIVRIGKQVVESCVGVPLAIKTAGTLLSNKSYLEWQSFEKQELSKIIPREKNDIISILKLSFYHLQPRLKHCFAFCSLFSKDTQFSREELIRLWIAHGFIHTSTAESLEDVGNQYLMHLLYMSFFQEPEEDNLGNIVFVKMHYHMHDLAMEVAKPGYLFVGKCDESRYEKVRHVSSEDGKQTLSADILSNRCDANRIRTLLHTNLYSYSSFKHLRVLALPNMDMTEVPKSICELKSLRYLDISSNDFETVPNFISSLIKLQTLDLKENRKLKKLPKDLKKLRNLRHLVLDGCDNLICMPHEIGKLSCLRTLSMFVVDDKASYKRSADISELVGLNNLRGTLKIKNLRARESRSNPDIWNNKKGIGRLEIDFGKCLNVDITDDDALLDGGLQLPYLRELKISGYNGKVSYQDQNLKFQLPKLVNLKIYECNCNYLPNFGHLPNLKTIILSELNHVTYLSPINNLNCLERIEIIRMSSLQEIPPLDKLHHLKSIEFRDLSALTKMPSLPQNSSLESISLDNLRLVEYIQEEEYYISSTSPTNSNSVVTTIMYSPPIFPSLEILDLREMPNLKGWWKNVNPSSSLITPRFPLLSKVYTANCPNLMCMPFFPNVELLAIYNNSCNSKIIQQMECTLKWVSNNCSNDWKASSSTTSSLIHPFSKLKDLQMTLESVEYVTEGLLRHFTSVKRLVIQNYALMKDTLPGNLRILRGTLQELEIIGYLKFMPDWITEFTSLQQLTCSKQKVLTQGLDLLTSLKQLRIWYCDELTILPETITSMTSLQYLHIEECRKLESLPDWLHQLTSLQELWISGCPILRERCRVNKVVDWPKIAHIPLIIIDLETVQDNRES